MTDTSFAAVAVAGLTGTSANIAAGLRLALILFAVMSGLAWLPNRGEDTAIERMRRRGWILLSIAALASSPIRAAILLGFHVAPAAQNLADAVACAAATGCFIVALASRGLMRGLSAARVRRGVLTNLVVVSGIVGATWLSR